MLRNAKWFIGGGLVYSSVAFGTYIYVKKTKKEDDVNKDVAKTSITAKERLQLYETQANDYDKAVSTDELFMGVPLLRRFLMRHAAGRVLEVSAGTCRNLKYYPKECTVIAVDASEAMLEEGRTKSTQVANVHFGIMSSENINFPDDSFDTVVQTFGLCSVDDPVKVLKEMQRVCKPTGRILLLERGQSSYDGIAKILNTIVQEDSKKWGCYSNRDIDTLVKQAGMDIFSHHTWHFGTTHYMIAGGSPSTKE